MATATAYISRPSTLQADAELLTVCASLADQQAQWQTLWAATPDEPDGGPVDLAFDTFTEFTWPGTRIADRLLGNPSAIDLPARLLTLPATTQEGLVAKAAAVLAISDASTFTGDCRPDEIELLRSVAIDAAGLARRLVGGDHAETTPGRSNSIISTSDDPVTLTAGA